ncbi:heptaprenyl diphosphate synthase component 1 [Paenalkalicoccus suaedae]|uniref:Heptaprenyl diphosphate synthase component 1 n=1 Tax=Paenalkalicoccus suaedae TaxID=2592382 RepID=A0A859FE10_9BACI|nr:heptaprenyl diphosphate synthase component 1 [Paenalkalicoccus suaedae]QKS71088.1 heptaprenyl diphosphate synthase component 1 [Paenalkalicoccus suaedae]
MMTAIHDNQQEIQSIYADFHSLTRHSYLHTYLPYPTIDDYQAKLLLCILQEKGLNHKDRHTLTLATLLVQAAMNIHDKVNSTELTDDFSWKDRQLTVLAGDYYSALYYHTLSGRLESYLPVLSNAIQDINEAKMRIYKRIDPEYLLYHDVAVIKSALVTQISLYLDDKALSKAVSALFFYESLLREKDRRASDEKPTLATLALPKENLQLERLIHDAKEGLLLEIEQVGTKSGMPLRSMYDQVTEDYRIRFWNRKEANRNESI